MRAEAVIEAGTRDPVTVRDFDGIDAGGVERAGDRDGLLERILVNGFVIYLFGPGEDQ